MLLESQLFLAKDTKVYTGNLNCTQQGWNDFRLTTPYTYSGSQNLVVVIMDQSGQYDGSSYKFYYATSSNNINKYAYTDTQSYITFPSNDTGTPTVSSSATSGNVTYYPVTRFCAEQSSVSFPTVISTVEDWNAFCAAVNSGHSYSGETVTMTANVGTVNTMCGTYTSDSDYKAFKGTFNGGGHTLTVNYTNQQRFAAPFKFLENATISNLRTTGTITGNSSNDGKLLAGIAGVSKGTTNIIGCSSNMNIISYFNNGDDVALAGLVASTKGSGTLTVEGCAFEGSMTAYTTKANHSSGIVGYPYSNATINVRNTVFAPSSLTLTTGDTDYSSTFARVANSATVNIQNCYYTRVLGVVQGKERYTITGQSPATVAMSGTETNYGASGIKAYKNGSTQLPGLVYNGTIIAGNSDIVNLTLSGSNNGYLCDHSTLSGSGSSYTLTMTANNTVISADTSTPKYHIANTESETAMTWNQFVAKVNGGTNYSGQTIYLDEDISPAVTAMAGVITGESTCNYAFKGTFDGQGHTLTVNLTSGTLSGDWYYTAPFRVIDGATIKNLKTTGTVTQNSGKGAAGLAGHTTGTCTITNCVSDVTINSLTDGDGTHGGFISEIRGNTTMNGCAFTGSITGSTTRYCGGFVGYKYSGTATLNNCVFAPTAITFDADHSGDNSANFVRPSGGGTLNNCYFTQTCGSVVQGKLMHSITGVLGITVANAGTATSYTPETSTIVGYGTGIKFNNILYAANNENVSLNLTGGNNYTADYGTLTGNGNPYTLSMTDNNTIISAIIPYTITATANPAEGGTVTFMPGPANSTSASTHLPLDSYRDYSFSQQIYTPEEIGGGVINSIALYSVNGANNQGTNYTRTLAVYMAHTSKTEFSSTSDWISNSGSPDMVLVYSGPVTFNLEEWNTINFTTPFTYDGARNLVLTISDNTGYSESADDFLDCRTITSNVNCSLNYGWSQFNPSSPSGNGERLTQKNQILVNGSATRTFPGNATCTLVATANESYHFVDLDRERFASLHQRHLQLQRHWRPHLSGQLRA